jgi:hypothetical protein
MSTEDFSLAVESLEKALENLDFPPTDLPSPEECRIKAGKAARVGHAELRAKFLGQLREVELGERNVEAVQYWKNRRFSNLRRRAKKSLENVVSQYFDSFNDIIFSGTLGNGCCKLVWSDVLNNGKWVGCAEPYRESHTCIVRIVRRTDVTCKKTLLHLYIGVILHEMAHAFVELYTRARCGRDECRGCLENSHGHTGHGFTWQLITRAIENTTIVALGLNVNIGRSHHLRTEIEACVKARRLELEEVVSLYRLEKMGYAVQINKQGFDIKHTKVAIDCGD